MIALQPAGKNSPPREIVRTRVLVVDDEPLIRWSLCTALAAAGFDAIAAHTEEEAGVLAAEWPPPRVALIDIGADGQGRGLVAEIRRIYSNCRFIGMSTARRGAVGLQCEGVEMIEKPFELAGVVRLVTDLCGAGLASMGLGAKDVREIAT